MGKAKKATSRTATKAPRAPKTEPVNGTTGDTTSAAEAALAPNRKLKTPKYRSFRLHKSIKHPAPPLPSSFRLFVSSLKVLRRHWKLFLGIVSVYGVLTIVFVGLTGGDISATKTSLDQISGHGTNLNTGATLVSDVLSTTGDTSDPAAGTYQALLLLVGSLAVIWALRHSQSAKQIRVRDSYYKGMFPLIPFALVLLVVGLQLVPLAVGSFLYSTVINNGIAVFAVEKIAWALLLFLLGVLSFYMICSSIFGLYIVTLPDMTPLRALRAARQLVLYRRWSVMRKILFLPIVLILLAAAVMLPAVLFITSFAAWVFFLFGMVALALFHSYMYALYRTLL